MMALLSLILGGGKGTKISLIILLVALVFGGCFVGLKIHEVHSLSKELSDLKVEYAVLQRNNQVLESNQKEIVSANQACTATVKGLTDERAANVVAVKSLAANNKRSKEALDKLEQMIEEMKKDSKNDGPVAPVLKQIVEEIQKQRSSR